MLHSKFQTWKQFSRCTTTAVRYHRCLILDMHICVCIVVVIVLFFLCVCVYMFYPSSFPYVAPCFPRQAPRIFGGGGNAGNNLSVTTSRSRDKHRREDRVDRHDNRQEGTYRELVRGLDFSQMFRGCLNKTVTCVLIALRIGPKSLVVLEPLFRWLDILANIQREERREGGREREDSQINLLQTILFSVLLYAQVDERALRDILDMGFNKEAARQALMDNNNNLEVALNSLLTGPSSSRSNSAVADKPPPRGLYLTGMT